MTGLRCPTIDDYRKSGGPVFFKQSGERPYECAEAGSVLLYAMAVGAMVIGIGHRFFGKSVPIKLPPTTAADWTASEVALLALNNVHLDSVKFMQHVKVYHLTSSQRRSHCMWALTRGKIGCAYSNRFFK